MTFSLAARCARTGQFGVVVTSSSPAVGARCAHVRANVGAVSTQNITDPRLGPRLLNLMAQGHPANAAMADVIAEEEFIQFRQLIAVDSSGRTAAYSGGRTLGRYQVAEAENAVAAGNLLSAPGVPAAMVEAFARDVELDIGDRIVAALWAGFAAGGEEGPVHSAGLLISGSVAWPIADLRVDWSDDPIGELERLWRLWKPQMDDYIMRALNPSAAPSYGVPGDLEPA
jgi:uncharacterized Ntn-hydrolase superfamily protein